MSNNNVSFPAIVNLGIFRGACQCKCVHCPVGRTDQRLRKKTYGEAEIGVEVFRLFCEEIKQYDTTVRLHSVGEPTLHSRFTELLEIIRALEIKHKFWIFTNGLFKPGLAKELVEHVEIIEVSLNATNADDYLQTKGVDGYETVVANVMRMREWIAKRSLTTRVVLTKVQSTEAKDREFLSFWRERDFECFVRSFHTYSGILQGRQAAPSNAELPKCLVPWRRFNLDGTLTENCVVAVNCFNVLFQYPDSVNSQAVMGRFPELGLLELWNGSALQQLRSELERGRPTRTACDRCTECLTSTGPRAENVVSQTIE